jgi:PIN domain nuclease of toxin-antitoxin system
MASPSRLDERVREAIASPENQVLLSSASAWEIAIKTASGRLDFPVEQFDEIVRNLGFGILPILAVPCDRRRSTAAASRGSVRPNADRAGDC